MTAREAARRYSASWQRATVGFATTLLHHYRGHDGGKHARRPGTHQQTEMRPTEYSPFAVQSGVLTETQSS
jgi:hypothetical protein